MSSCFLDLFLNFKYLVSPRTFCSSSDIGLGGAYL